MCRLGSRVLAVMGSCLMTAIPLLSTDVTLENNAGVKVIVADRAEGYALGGIYLNDQQVETPLFDGMIRFLDTEKGTDQWLYASNHRQIDKAKVVFSGEGKIGRAKVTFEVTIEIPPDVRAVRIIYDYSVNRNVANQVAILQYHNEFSHAWKGHIYPWAEDAKYVHQDPLNWIGVPSLFMYRDDRSLGLLWGIDPNSDYLNPTTWTKDFGLYYTDGVIPAQYRIGGDGLKKKIDYHCPMQIVLTDQPDPDEMIIDLIKNWIALNNYKPEDLHVRSHEEALELFIEGRKKTEMWYPGQGYRLEMGDPSSAFIYIGEAGLSAYFDYLVYERTGDEEWRKRAFEQMDFILKGQNTNRDDPNYGVIHTAYSLVDYGPVGKGFNSADRGTNRGYKPDLNAHLARYMLLLWQKVKDKEGINREDWYQSATMAAEWMLRQQNNDGGFPQKVYFEPVEVRYDENWMTTGQPDRVRFKSGEKSRSTTSGRALPSLRYIYKITGDDKYLRAMKKLEDYTLRYVQNQYYYTSHHPDLPPYELEEASIWGVAEYWLDRYVETQDETYLKHAVADAYLSLTWWCPKQLSWVDNPTQMASTEQQHFLQYSIYCYQNRKVECLWRIADATGDPLFDDIANRIAQGIYASQVTTGDLMGATHERIADPWLARGDGKGDFNSMGSVYMSEQSLDLFLQTIKMEDISK